MNELERLARHYAGANESMRRHIADYNLAIDAARKKYGPALRAGALRLEDAHAQLRGEIEDHPELFVKRKTLTLYGVRVGLKKMKGKITWASAAKVLERIKKFFPCTTGLVLYREAPNKDGLAKLPAADLKRLGCEVVEAGEAPYIKLLDTEGEKFVRDFLAVMEGAA